LTGLTGFSTIEDTEKKMKPPINTGKHGEELIKSSVIKQCSSVSTRGYK